MKYATTRDERLALIKEIAERKKKMSAIRKKSSSTIMKAKKASPMAREFVKTPDDSSKNPYYYTDSSKYANEYYGEVYRETTRFDNDWGDY
jgi:hypothetical protein